MTGATDPLPGGDEVDLAGARASALSFVRDEPRFAQVTTLDDQGFPVTRTMTAFLEDDWSVALVQRRVHRRLRQWKRDPRTLVSWVGDPAPGSTNEHPHVFDLGLRVPRLVSVRGSVEEMPADWTHEHYEQAMRAHRHRGNTRAPWRTREQAANELFGVLLHPVRVRLEGFGHEAESFTWSPPQRGGGSR
jgi:hypothetical protein